MIFFNTKLRFQYHETDQMDIVHHSNYLKYYEYDRIECCIFYKEVEEKGILMPVHSLDIKYIKPLNYDEEFIVKISLDTDIKMNMKFEYEIYNSKNELCNKSTINIVFLEGKNKRLISASEFLLNTLKK